MIEKYQQEYGDMEHESRLDEVQDDDHVQLRSRLFNTISDDGMAGTLMQMVAARKEQAAEETADPTSSSNESVGNRSEEASSGDDASAAQSQGEAEDTRAQEQPKHDEKEAPLTLEQRVQRHLSRVTAKAPRDPQSMAFL